MLQRLKPTLIFYSEYNHRRQTTDLHVDYYTKADFDTEHYKKGSMALRRLEKRIESDYIENLENSCYQERLTSKCLVLSI